MMAAVTTPTAAATRRKRRGQSRSRRTTSMFVAECASGRHISSVLHPVVGLKGRRDRIVMSLMAGAVLVTSSCSASHAASTAAAKATATPAVFVGPNAPSATPQATLTAAVDALLSAETRGDHAASFVLLSDE